MSRSKEERDLIAAKIADKINELGLEFGGRMEDVDLVLELEDEVNEMLHPRN